MTSTNPSSFVNIRVQNLCCEKEAKLINGILLPIEGVDHVHVNVIGRLVSVTYLTSSCGADTLVNALNGAQLGASIQDVATHAKVDSKQNKQSWFEMFYAHILVGILITLTALAEAVDLSFIDFPTVSTHDLLLVTTIELNYFAFAVLLIGGIPLFQRACLSLYHGIIDMQVYMSFAVVGSIALGEFTEAALVVTVFASSREIMKAILDNIDQSVREITDRMQSEMFMLPEYATLASGKRVLASSLIRNDIIAIRIGEMVPVDGTVEKGECTIDESSLTGESVPVLKTKTSLCLAGTIIQNGYVEIKVQFADDGLESKESNDDAAVERARLKSLRISSLIHKIEESMRSTNMQQSIDKFAEAYTWFTLLLAVSFIIVSMILSTGNLLTSIFWSSTITKCVVLIVLACPCALSMAAPICIASSLRKAAEAGVMIVGGAQVLEKLSQARYVCFDKTGTLTEGRFQVTEVVLLKTAENNRQDTVFYQPSIETETETMKPIDKAAELLPLHLAASVEAKSTHPIANALVSCAIGCITDAYMKEVDSGSMSESSVNMLGKVKGFKREVFGVTGNVTAKNSEKSYAVCVSNESLIPEDAAFEGKEEVMEFLRRCKMLARISLFVWIDGKIQLCVAISDVVRRESRETVDKLMPLVNVTMLTGDMKEVAVATGKMVGIEDVLWRQLPDMKLHHIQQLKISQPFSPSKTSVNGYGSIEHDSLISKSTDTSACVIMVGDGINDGPSIAAADVGIAVSTSSTAVATVLKVANVIFLDKDIDKSDKDLNGLLRLPWLIRLARSTIGSWSIQTNSFPCGVSSNKSFQLGRVWENVILAIVAKLLVIVILFAYSTASSKVAITTAVFADVIALLLVL